MTTLRCQTMLMSVRCNTSLWLNVWFPIWDPFVCVLSADPGDGAELHTLKPCLTLDKRTVLLVYTCTLRKTCVQ